MRDAAHLGADDDVTIARCKQRA